MKKKGEVATKQVGLEDLAPIEVLKEADQDVRLPSLAPAPSFPREALEPVARQQTPAVGQRVTRLDGRLHGLGQSKFVDDLTFPGMIHAKILRSQYPHAHIVSIDTSGAEAMPGVLATLTGAEIPTNLYGSSHKDQPFLADDKVRHMGDGVAAVAAVTEQIAEQALTRIKVEYEPLAAVFDPLDAMGEDAPKVHDPESNVYAKMVIKKGDVDQALARSDLVLENRYTTQMVEHVPLEPHAAIAAWDPTGRLTVWSNCARITLGRADIARSLNMQINRVRVVGSYIGGNFGGKNEITFEPVLALLSKKSGRPVKGVFSRRDEFVSSTTRHPFVMDYTTGVLKSGRILARKVRLILDGGAYASWSQTTLGKAGTLAAGPYKIDNLEIETLAIYTNKTVAGAMRGFGAPQVCFAHESQIDDMARELALDPLEFRLINAFDEGAISPTGQVLKSVAVKQSLTTAANRFGWKEWRRTPKRGRGIGCMWYPVGATAKPNPSAATVKVNEDGTATVLTGTVETGQGALTVLGQIAAEELGIVAEEVHLVSGDTDTTPPDEGANASRTTYVTGNAIRLAAKEAKAILFQAAAPMFGVRPEQLEVRDRKVLVIGFPQKNLPIAEVARQSQLILGRPAIGTASYNPPTVALDPETGQGKPFNTYVYAAQIAEVEVDEETGQVNVLRIAAAHDCGTPINPMLVEGQVQGGISMGIGFALHEEMLFEDGVQMNPDLANYILPTSLDVPAIEVDIVDNYDPTGPFGAKGVGEPTSVPTAAAIVNAIDDAIGVRITSLPATAEKVLAAIKEQRPERKRLTV